MLTIALCQTTIEIKRYLVYKEEERIDRLAQYAVRQIEEATRKNKLVLEQLGVQFLNHPGSISTTCFMAIVEFLLL